MKKRIEGMQGYRDNTSGALIFTDDIEYNRVLSRKMAFIEQKSNEDTINNMRDEINELKALISDLTSN